MASSISCEILKIIQINKINTQFQTLRHAFHFHFSPLRFLFSLNTETSKKFDRNSLAASVFVREKVVIYPDSSPGAHVFVMSAETPNSIIRPLSLWVRP